MATDRPITDAQRKILDSRPDLIEFARDLLVGATEDFEYTTIFEAADAHIDPGSLNEDGTVTDDEADAVAALMQRAKVTVDFAHLGY